MLKVRNLCIHPPLLLAPMAGITHSAFRCLLLQLGGVGLLSTEMLSAKRLPQENAAISPFLISTEAEHPLSYQLLVADKNQLAPAIDRVHQLGGDAIAFESGLSRSASPAIRRRQ